MATPTMTRDLTVVNPATPILEDAITKYGFTYLNLLATSDAASTTGVDGFVINPLGDPLTNGTLYVNVGSSTPGSENFKKISFGLTATADTTDIDIITIPGNTYATGQDLVFRLTGLYYKNIKLNAGDNRLFWVPAAGVSGTVDAFQVRALDNVDNIFGNGNDTTSALPVRGTDYWARLDVTSVNDAPSFTKGADITVDEDSAPAVGTAWATAVSAGPANESAQLIDFIVSNDNNALFSSQPSLDSAGNLSYTLATDANGSATVTVQAHDNGGTANGGVDTSAAQTFNIVVNPVNDVPVFTAGADQSVQPGTGPQTVAAWATGISAGPADESGQVVDFIVTNDNNALFSAQPSIDSTGTLTYTFNDTATGSATVSVQIHDNGGTANGGVDTSAIQSFVIDSTDITPPNAPVITGITTDSGVTGDHLTNDTTLTFDGTAEANSTVTVYIDTVWAGTTTADALGAWHYAYATTLSDGVTYTASATATDAANNTGAYSTDYAVTIDTTPPAAPAVTSIVTDGGSNSTDFTTNDTTISISGSFNSADTLLLDVTFNGTTYHWNDINTPELTAVGDVWTLDAQAVSLVTGTYPVVATATDTAGNPAVGATQNVIIDTSAPTAPTVTAITDDSAGASSTDFITNDTTLMISGTYDAAQTDILQVTFNSVPYVQGGGGPNSPDLVLDPLTGTWTLDATLDVLLDGPYTIAVTSTNLGGNSNSGSQTVTIDTIADAPTLDTAITTDSGNNAADQITNDTTITFTGIAEFGASVTLYDTDETTVLGTGTADIATGVFSITTGALGDGLHAVNAVQVDIAGNTSAHSAGLPVTVDTIGPNPQFSGAHYEIGASHDLYLTGINMDTILSIGQNETTDIAGQLDFSKLVWNYDNDVINQHVFTAAEIDSAHVIDAYTLQVTLNAAGIAAIEGNADFGTLGTMLEDSVQITDNAFVAEDGAGNAAISGAIDAPGLTVLGDLNQPQMPQTFHYDFGWNNSGDVYNETLGGTAGYQEASFDANVDTLVIDHIYDSYSDTSLSAADISVSGDVIANSAFGGNTYLLDMDAFGNTFYDGYSIELLGYNAENMGVPIELDGSTITFENGSKLLTNTGSKATLAGTGGHYVAYYDESYDGYGTYNFFRKEYVQGSGDDQLIAGNKGDRLLGNGGDDLLIGGNGADSLYGGWGNDVLYGGKGNDYLNGGSESDTFVYTILDTADDGHDVIAGFELNDTIYFAGGGDVFNITMQQSGADTLLILNPDETVRLVGVDINNLGLGNFGNGNFYLDGGNAIG